MAMSRSRGDSRPTARSPIQISPPVISSRPAIIRSSVDLPQPDGPTSTMNSPLAIVNSTSSTAVTPPAYTFVTFSSRISDMHTLIRLDGGAVFDIFSDTVNVLRNHLQ